ncbi:hypothetical protein PspR76_15955 [Pseudomonas sp. R76]|nr:hypothetical protein PspR76_15955 [Pseudomonas sp. R76]
MPLVRRGVGLQCSDSFLIMFFRRFLENGWYRRVMAILLKAHDNEMAATTKSSAQLDKCETAPVILQATAYD